MTTTQPVRTSAATQRMPTATASSSLADVLERVLDKGIVIAGDISVSVGSTELLNIRIRLLIASVDKAKEMGINWWESDPYLSSKTQHLMESNQLLLEQIKQLEQEVKSLKQLAGTQAPEALQNEPAADQSL